MLREVVSDLEPRCLRAGEDMIGGSNAGIVVERSGRHDEKIPLRNKTGHRTSADAAESISETLRRLQSIAGQVIFASQPAKVCRFYVKV